MSRARGRVFWGTRGTILGTGIFSRRTSCDENSQLCALNNNLLLNIELLNSNDIQEGACTGPGRELDRCIEIITPSAWCLVPVSSFPSCETPDGQVIFARQCSSLLSSVMISFVSSKATASKPQALEPPYRCRRRGPQVWRGGAARFTDLGVGVWRRQGKHK